MKNPHIDRINADLEASGSTARILDIQIAPAKIKKMTVTEIPTESQRFFQIIIADTISIPFVTHNDVLIQPPEVLEHLRGKKLYEIRDFVRKQEDWELTEQSVKEAIKSIKPNQ